jgi:hypothetical protein
MRSIGFIAVLSLFYFSFAHSVLASAPIVISYPTETLSLDTSFIVTATMSGLSKKAIYRLRVAIAQSGTSNYFGSTYDGSVWHKGSLTDENFLSITTDENGAWGGDIQGKIDSDDSNFTTGSGTYDLKIGRYTQTGSTATWSDPVSISIVVPPTPTPTNTPTPTPTLTPTPVPTNTPTPKKIPTPTPTLKPSASPTPENLEGGTLGESTQSAEEILPTGKQFPEENNLVAAETKVMSNNWFGKIFIAVGVVFILTCVILTFRTIRKGKAEQNEEK